MISSRRQRYVRKSIGSTGQHRRKLSRQAIYQGVLQMVVLLSLDRNHELSLLTSNHIPFASRRKHDVLIPPTRGTSRDLARVVCWGMNRVSVSWGEAEE